MHAELQDLHLVVTGSGGALGGAVVGRLLELGAVCHLPLRTAGGAARFGGAPAGRVHVVEGVDLTDERSVAGLYAGLPGLWASIHCAGGFAMAPILGTEADDFSRMWAANALSCFLCCREAVRVMRGTGGGGRIVNVAARPALEPRAGAGMLAYTASKAAVAALTQALAEELASEGIWVNAVAPSILDTTENRAAMPGADHASWPAVEEVAATIVHLASPLNGSARGGLIPVYGRSG
jgi:NAD(P)-dependent dehydrogenase (short-subunit alcohol dehydrogenase family)